MFLCANLAKISFKTDLIVFNSSSLAPRIYSEFKITNKDKNYPRNVINYGWLESKKKKKLKLYLLENFQKLIQIHRSGKPC